MKAVGFIYFHLRSQGIKLSFQLHSRTVKVVMYFQISPYCEDNEEIQIFPQGDKFLVGRDFIFFLIAKKSLFSQTSIEYGLLSESIKMFVQNKDIRLSFQ